MSKGTFLLLLVILLLLWAIKKAVLDTFHKNDKMVWLTQTGVNYFFTFLLILLVIIGMLFTQNTKTDFSNVSAGFKQVRDSSGADKPHRYFDIDFSRLFPSSN